MLLQFREREENKLRDFPYCHALKPPHALPNPAAPDPVAPPDKRLLAGLRFLTQAFPFRENPFAHSEHESSPLLCSRYKQSIRHSSTKKAQKGNITVKKNIARLLLLTGLALSACSAFAQAQLDGPTLPPPPLPGVVAM